MTELAELRLEPGLLAWIARIAELSATDPELASLDPRIHRAAALRLADRLGDEFTLPAPSGLETIDTVIDGPGCRLPLRLVRPAGATGPLPTQLWLHGGGFVEGSHLEHGNVGLIGNRVRDTGIQFAELDYRLAPEHPYPAAVLDAIAALNALIARPELLVDQARLGIGGNSAGAAVAGSVALRLLEHPDEGPALLHQSLEVPAAALVPVGDSAREYAEGFGLEGAELLADIYTGGSPADPLASLLHAPRVQGLPPTLVHVAEHDPLRDAGLAYAERLRNAGVPTRTIVGEGQLHGSPALTAATEGARRWQREHAAVLREAYGTESTPA